MKNVILSAGVIAGLGLHDVGGQESEHTPNVVFFLVDDLGYGDMGYSGSELAETPNIDHFARENMVFTSGYAPAAHCSPSRGAILTGQYPARLHITTWIGGNKPKEYKNLLLPTQKNYLSDEVYTLGKYFKSRGYTTAQLGKWHLGGNVVPVKNHGFDHVIGWTSGAGPGNNVKDWFGPYPTIADMTGPSDEYITDRLTDEAIQFIETHGKSPFFMMLQHYDVHGPLIAPDDVVQKYVDRGRSLDRGVENAIFLAKKEKIDDSFGRIMNSLETQGLADNTIVIFFSDNGGVSYWSNNSPLRRGKKFPYEGGIRVPMMMRVPGMTRPGARCDAPVHGVDFFPTLVELSGGDPGNLDTILDGVSFVPLLRGEGSLDRQALYWHIPQLERGDGQDIYPQGIVRMDGWKLIHYYGGIAADELYNLDEDLREEKNLAAAFPERVSQMKWMLEQHLQEVDAQRVEATFHTHTETN